MSAFDDIVRRVAEHAEEVLRCYDGPAESNEYLLAQDALALTALIDRRGGEAVAAVFAETTVRTFGAILAGVTEEYPSMPVSRLVDVAGNGTLFLVCPHEEDREPRHPT